MIVFQLCAMCSQHPVYTVTVTVRVTVNYELLIVTTPRPASYRWFTGEQSTEHADSLDKRLNISWNPFTSRQPSQP